MESHVILSICCLSTFFAFARGAELFGGILRCDVPTVCTKSVPATCYYPAECHKDPVHMGGEITVPFGKREVDCSKPYMCDRCIPSTCYFHTECHKDPITSGPILGTLGKRCTGSELILGKRDVDCSIPYMCDNCSPSTCFYRPECHKTPLVQHIGNLGTLGKRCGLNLGTLG